MPIKGVSEIIRLPRQGKIRTGIKEEVDGCICPKPTDYFVCPDEVKAVFGEKPTELRIMFPTEDSEQWASQYYRCYSEDGSLICRGNGETALARVETVEDGKTVSKLKEMPCNTDRCPCHKQGYCRKVMNLQFLLPECPGFGVYQLDTSSFFSIVNINSSLELIRNVSNRVSMIPLLLKLVEQEVMLEGEKKPVQVLSLTPQGSLSDVQKQSLVPPGQVLLLPPPDSEAPDDLFPPEMLKQDKPSSYPGKEIIDLWIKVKSKLLHLDVLDCQIYDWFKRNHHIDVRLSDFDSVAPPSHVTRESLEHFLKALEYQADHS